jgi:hypothetical protein
MLVFWSPEVETLLLLPVNSTIIDFAPNSNQALT